MAGNDDVVAVLIAEREQLEQRLAAIDAALGALDGTMPVAGMFNRRLQVGEDKLMKVLDYVRRKRGWVRQAEIVRDLDINSGTGSTAVAVLEQQGLLERGPKQDRSLTWRAVK